MDYCGYCGFVDCFWKFFDGFGEICDCNFVFIVVDIEDCYGNVVGDVLCFVVFFVYEMGEFVVCVFVDYDDVVVFDCVIYCFLCFWVDFDWSFGCLLVVVEVCVEDVVGGFGYVVDFCVYCGG